MTIQQALVLAVQLQVNGDLAQAESICQQVLQVAPESTDALHLLGIICCMRGAVDDGIALMRHALKFSPNDAGLHCDLGLALYNLNQLDAAEIEYREALKLAPNLRDALNNLGNLLVRTDRVDEAIDSFREALKIDPNFPEAHFNLSHALALEAQFDDAIAHVKRAIEFRPNYGDAYANLGSYLKEQGRIAEAEQAMRRAVELLPNHSGLWSNLLLTMQYADNDEVRILAEHQRWLDICIQPSVPAPPAQYSNNRDPNRPLRIGYVSADFYSHPVGRFILPIFEHHDQAQFQIECFYNDTIEDEVTARLKCACDQWHSIIHLNDAQAFDLIRTRKIDILIDLGAHTALNRLPLFARKPAPVQITYLAYPGTTGLPQMDYRITDPHLEGKDRGYIEKPLMVRSYWCYVPPLEAISTAPASADSECITFGCLNRSFKLSDRCLKTWRRVLDAVPDSIFLLHAQSQSERVRAQSILGDRVEFVAQLDPSHYFQTYNRIDIALDTVPFNGGTTTCDALYMSVPVLSLVGDRPVSRAGLSILSQLDLQALCAASEERLIALARDLAADKPGLLELKKSLRARMIASSLCDGAGCTRDFEKGLRTAWMNHHVPA